MAAPRAQMFGGKAKFPTKAPHGAAAGDPTRRKMAQLAARRLRAKGRQ